MKEQVIFVCIFIIIIIENEIFINIFNCEIGSVWLCIFEAPKDQFAEAFNKSGQVMLNNMFFNPQS